MRIHFGPISALSLLPLLAGVATPAYAGALSIQVVGADGQPVADSVVTLRATGRPTPAPASGGRFSVDQKNIQFHPFVSVVPVGSEVSFPNFDSVRHHVYSFSPAKKFELKLYARDQTRKILFDRPGVVAIGCNIHDAMSAYIVVTDSGWTAKTDAAGRVSFAGLGAGGYTMTVWHPNMRAPANQIVSAVAMTAADKAQRVAVTLRAPAMHGMSGH